MDGFYSSSSSDFYILSYEELKFIEAEAAWLNGNTARAYSAYEDAVRTNMLRMGIDATAIDSYLSSNSLAAANAEADLTLEKIMFQKYLTMPFHPEVWVDMRRYDYSDQVYPGFEQPANADASLNGEFIRRIDMFDAEIQYNVDETTRIGALELDYRAQPVWWDIQN